MKLLASTAVMLALGAFGASAATMTVDFDSPVAAPLNLVPDSPGIVGGNCADDEAPCLGVNSNGEAVLSIAAPETFSLASFWFQLLGNDDDLTVTTDKGSLTLAENDYGFNNGGQVIDLSTNAIFTDIAYVSFLTNEGNARIDDITVSYDDPPIGAVPLPAAGWLLIAGLGGLAAMRRRG